MNLNSTSILALILLFIAAPILVTNPGGTYRITIKTPTLIVTKQWCVGTKGTGSNTAVSSLEGGDEPWLA